MGMIELLESLLLVAITALAFYVGVKGGFKMGYKEPAEFKKLAPRYAKVRYLVWFVVGLVFFTPLMVISGKLGGISSIGDVLSFLLACLFLGWALLMPFEKFYLWRKKRRQR